MVREYIGARYVPRFLGTYDATQTYEALDVVDNGLGTSYISKIPTPAGTPLTDTDHWAIYGASSGAIINLQNQIGDLSQLDTTDKDNLVEAINENKNKTDDIGDLTSLNTIHKTNLVEAVNENANTVLERHVPLNLIKFIENRPGEIFCTIATDGAAFYITGSIAYSNPKVYKIDLNGNILASNDITLNRPHENSMCYYNNRLYIVDTSNTVTVVDATTLTVLNTFTLDRTATAIEIFAYDSVVYMLVGESFSAAVSVYMYTNSTNAFVYLYSLTGPVSKDNAQSITANERFFIHLFNKLDAGTTIIGNYAQIYDYNGHVSYNMIFENYNYRELDDICLIGDTLYGITAQGEFVYADSAAVLHNHLANLTIDTTFQSNKVIQGKYTGMNNEVTGYKVDSNTTANGTRYRTKFELNIPSTLVGCNINTVLASCSFDGFPYPGTVSNCGQTMNFVISTISNNHLITGQIMYYDPDSIPDNHVYKYILGRMRLTAINLSTGTVVAHIDKVNTNPASDYTNWDTDVNNFFTAVGISPVVGIANVSIITGGILTAPVNITL